jgi:tRNA-specific 2-thiouridylase
VLGQHEGLPAYTVGQRKGLEISAAEPLYVLAIESAENTLIVGSAAELGRDECVVAGMHYVDGELPTAPFSAMAQIRYRAHPATVVVTPLPDRGAHVRFATSQRDITPGQFLVLYEGEVVLGGGTICMPHESML